MSDLQKAALAAAPQNCSEKDTLKDIADPLWGLGGSDSDWCNHVPNELRDRWENLSDDDRYSAYIAARQAALEQDG